MARGDEPTVVGKTRLALLLNDTRRQTLEDKIRQQVGDPASAWRRYSQWGNELFHSGQTKQSPKGEPSPLLSDFYRCVDCHNVAREDARLTVQDPEERFARLKNQPRDLNSVAPKLMPGTTMWGIVHRESFYNGAFEIYRALTVADERPMDPTQLEDAIQICCRYCSVGRFAEPWEIDCLLAYFWDLELTLSDLDLPPEVQKGVAAVLLNPQESALADQLQMRQFLRRQFLTRSEHVVTVPPTITSEGVGPYPDRLEFLGDVEIGKQVYALACEHCHGPGKCNEVEGSGLVADLRRFHRILSLGTERDDRPYMPMFTAQRLSRQQIIDLQTYLMSLR